MNLDSKIFDTLMEKQEWSLKLDENKKQLANSIKEMQEFSKSFGDLENKELDQARSKIFGIEVNDGDKIEDKDQLDLNDDDNHFDDVYPPQRSISVYEPKLKNSISSGTNDILDRTLDLNDDFLTPQPRRNESSPTGSENPEFEEYVNRLD